MMNLIRWRPADIDNLFANAIPHRLPALDLRETDEAFVVEAELPGYTAEEIEIDVHGDTLSLKAHKEESSEKTDAEWLLRERRVDSFERTIRLPDNVDVENVEARARDGILTIKLPKRTESRPHKITVKSDR